jgi:hypothetical protein
MTGLETQNLSRIDQHKNPKLPLDGDLTLPYNDGLSLVNIPRTITDLLGAPAFGNSALDSSITSLLGGPYKKVVFLLVDALGYFLLQDMIWSGQSLGGRVSLPLSPASAPARRLPR